MSLAMSDDTSAIDVRTVILRLEEAGATLLATPENGFVDLRFAPDAAPRVLERGRIDRHPYWRE